MEIQRSFGTGWTFQRINVSPFLFWCRMVSILKMIKTRLTFSIVSTVLWKFPHCFPIYFVNLWTHTLPRDWVSANVVPVLKQDDRHIPSYYQPISLTSVVAKTMDILRIHSEITMALESHQLISTHQFGFRKNHSTIYLTWGCTWLG